MKKGKNKTRRARQDIMRSITRNSRRKARQQTEGYDPKRYDKPVSEER